VRFAQDNDVVDALASDRSDFVVTLFD